MKKNKPPVSKPVPQKKAAAAFGRTQWIILALILLGVFIIYSPALKKDFINYDDDWYIFDNPFVNSFSLNKAGEIFSSFYFGQYSPIPMMFLGMLHSAAGNETFLYNLNSVLLHLINIPLVCWLVFRLRGNTFTALASAALFGICTMQVESVAWASAAFKTGFYAAFFLASLIAYTFYIKSNNIKHLAVCMLFFILSFLCKEQAAALVFSLVCIDFLYSRNLLSKKVIAEKIPFLLLSIAFGIITLMASKSNRDVLTYSHFSFPERILYASYAVGEYAVKLFAPYQLAAFYPYPSFKTFSPWFYLHPLMIAALVFLFIRTRKKNRFAAFGLLFFAANLLFSLALQIVSVREVVMADRYVYISSIGMFMIVSSSLQSMREKYKQNSSIIFYIFIFYLIVIAALTFQRTKVWKNTQVLLEDNLKNFVAPLPLVNLGVEYKKHGFVEKALANYNKSIQLYPEYGLAYVDRGNIYFDRGADSLAIADYDKAVSLNTRSPNVYANRGALFAKHKKYNLAFADFADALKMQKDFPNTYLNRAITYFEMNDYKAAIEDYSSYLKLKPDDAGIYCDRGVAYQNLNDDENALRDLNTAVSMSPGTGIYYLNRSFSYFRTGKKESALADALAAQKLGERVGSDYLEKLK